MFKSTQVQGDLGHVEQGATRLLGLEGLTVVQVVVDDAGGRIVHAVTADGVMAGCPECGVVSTSRKGRVVTFPRTSRTGRSWFVWTGTSTGGAAGAAASAVASVRFGLRDEQASDRTAAAPAGPEPLACPGLVHLELPFCEGRADDEVGVCG